MIVLKHKDRQQLMGAQLCSDASLEPSSQLQLKRCSALEESIAWIRHNTLWLHPNCCSRRDYLLMGVFDMPLTTQIVLPLRTHPQPLLSIEIWPVPNWGTIHIENRHYCGLHTKINCRVGAFFFHFNFTSCDMYWSMYKKFEIEKWNLTLSDAYYGSHPLKL